MRFWIASLIVSVFGSLWGQTWEAMGTPHLPSMQIRSMAAVPGVGILVGTAEGIVRIENYSGSGFGNIQAFGSDLPVSVADFLQCSEGGVLFVAQNGSGLLRVSEENSTFWGLSDSTLPDTYVRAFYAEDSREDVCETFWVGTTGGLMKYNEGEWTRWGTDNSALWSNHITCLAKSQDGILHVGSVNGGLIRIQGDSILSHWHSYNSWLHDNTVMDMAFDAEGGCWMATPSNGLMHFDSIHHHHYMPYNSGIPTNSLRKVSVDRFGRVWMLSVASGLICYTPNTGEWKVWNAENSVLPSVGLQHLLLTELNDEVVVWVGTLSEGLFVGFAPPVAGITLEDEIGLSFSIDSEGRIFPPESGAFSLWDMRGSCLQHYAGIEVENRLPALSSGMYILQQGRWFKKFFRP
jgi:hypothetical protein